MVIVKRVVVVIPEKERKKGLLFMFER